MCMLVTGDVVTFTVRQMMFVCKAAFHDWYICDLQLMDTWHFVGAEHLHRYWLLVHFPLTACVTQPNGLPLFVYLSS